MMITTQFLQTKILELQQKIKEMPGVVLDDEDWDS